MLIVHSMASILIGYCFLNIVFVSCNFAKLAVSSNSFFFLNRLLRFSMQIIILSEDRDCYFSLSNVCALFLSCIFVLAKISGVIFNRSASMILLKLGVLFQAIIKAILSVVS